MKKIGIILIFVFSIIVNVYFGFQKAGFHEDEYYTYFSSNRSVGLYQPDRQWQDRQTIIDEFAVKPGEGFNYGLVKLVQSWDVHPPFYYFIFHTSCSLVPGKFTKWTGILTNLLAFSLCFWVLFLLMEKLNISAIAEMAALIFYGVNPQTISCNMLIRMYAWLSLFVALCAYLHVRMIQAECKRDDEIKGIKEFMLIYMLPIMVVSYLGFLTQYFYLFFFVSIGVAFTAYLVFWKKKVLKGVIYVFSCAVSLGLAVISYPACLSHLFGGYRGSEAAGSMFDLGNTSMRVSFFGGLLNDFVFGGFFYLIAAVIVVSLIFIGIKAHEEKRENNAKNVGTGNIFSPELIILILGALGYFLLTSKAALLVGSASNRYEMPIYGIVIVLVFALLDKAICVITKKKKAGNAEDGKFGNARIIEGVVIFGAVAFLLFKGIGIDNRVLFLYPEDTEKIAYAADNKDQIAVVMFNHATAHNVWRLTDELLEYDRVFYMDEENLEKLSEPEVIRASKVILYIADDDYQEQAISNFIDSTGLTNMDQLFAEDMWKTYELY